MDGSYEILNFLTGDSLYTHQLPRAVRQCEPWLRAQFPTLMADAPGMPERLAAMDARLAAAGGTREKNAALIAAWIDGLRVTLGFRKCFRCTSWARTCTRTSTR